LWAVQPEIAPFWAIRGNPAHAMQIAQSRITTDDAPISVSVFFGPSRFRPEANLSQAPDSLTALSELNRERTNIDDAVTGPPNCRDS